MPLLDHFHPPLGRTRSWESFHSRWANAIGDYLNRVLPKRYVAEIEMHFGSQVAADVAELELLHEANSQQGNGGAGLAVQAWTLPAATLSMPAIYPDDLEVQVIDTEDCTRLVAVVELVSPSNKARPDARRTFAGKCAAYLQRGIGLVVLDVVTERHANLHNALLDLLGQPDTPRMPDNQYLYANAYRPLNQKDEGRIDAWVNALTVGGNLPTVPLALKGAWPIPLDLEARYGEARERARL